MQTWEKLVRFPDYLLAQVDPVEVNLACAEGLQGTEDINRAACCHTMDEWAKRVHEEFRRVHVLYDRNPGEYQNSKSYFRMLVLFTVLQRDIGVRYNAALIEQDGFFTDARNLFLHGVLNGREGTCSSLPPVFAAVGRRLGYPLKLVITKSHLFLRWDDAKGNCFNIECTSQGLNSDSDDHYLKWPLSTTKEEARKYCFLKSKSPREELALYLTNRGHCFNDNGQLKPAVEAHAWAAELEPANHLYSTELCRAMDRWREKLTEKWPQPFPRLTIYFPPRQFRQVPKELEQGIVHLRTMESLVDNKDLDARWWAPLRRGLAPSDLPSEMVVEYKTGDDFILSCKGA